jgi:hypothetical protein
MEPHGCFRSSDVVSECSTRVSSSLPKRVRSSYAALMPETAYWSVSCRRVDSEYGKTLYSTAGPARTSRS